MSKVKMKKIKLRAFTIPNQALDKSKSDILEKLKHRLKTNKSIVRDRSMILNPDDPNKEEDLLSYFKLTNTQFSGTILRIFYAEDTTKIPDDYLNHEQIQLSELEQVDPTLKMMFKESYYFYMNDSFLVTNLQGNITVKRFQTYINWLLENQRNETLYEFTPKTRQIQDTRLLDIKNIEVKDSVIYHEKNINNTDNRLISVGNDILKSLLGDVESFKEIKDQQIISAKLFIKFNRPKKMKKEAYEKIMSAYLKPISDTEDVTFITKKGVKLTGNDVLLTKDVEVEMTESKVIVEEQLLQAMEAFLKELS